MLKVTVAILSALAIALLIIAFTGFGPAFASQLQSCQPSLYTSDQFHCLTSGSQSATTGYVLYLAGAIAAFVAWGLGLLAALVRGRWGWFLVILLFSPLGSLLYGLFGPAPRSTRVMRSATAHAA